MWRINISAEKTEAVVFLKKTRLQLPELKIQSAKIDYVPKFRYLGVILDHRLSWKKALPSVEGQGTEALDSHEASIAFASFLIY
jgi:hypothetical protein